jgi:hypothetical protein
MNVVWVGLGAAVAIACGGPRAPSHVRDAVDGVVVSGAMRVTAVWGTAPGPFPRRWSVPGASAVALSPEEGTAAIVGDDGVYLVDVPSGVVQARLLGDLGLGARGAAAFSPDGTVLAIAARGCIHLVDVATRAELGCLPLGDDHGMWSVAFSPDGADLAAASGEGATRAFSIDRRRLVWASDGTPQGMDVEVAWPRADRIVIGPNLRGIMAATGAEVWSSTDHAAEDLVGVRDGALIVAGRFRDDDWNEAPVAAIDLDTGAVREVLGSGDGDVAALFGDGRVFVGGSQAGRIVGGRRARAGFRFVDAPWTMAATRDGRLAIVTRLGDALELWDLVAGRRTAVSDEQGAIAAIAVDDRGVITAAADGSVVVRDRGGELIVRDRAQALGCTAWAVAGRLAVCASSGLDSYGAPRVPSFELLDLGRSPVRRESIGGPAGDAVAVTADGIAWASAQGDAMWADVDAVRPLSGRHAISVRAPAAAIVARGRAVAFAGDRGLGVVDRRGRVRWLDDAPVVALAASPTGRWLAVAGLGQVSLWTGDTRRWSADARSPAAVAVRDDGRLVAVVERDGEVVTTRDGRTGAPVGELTLPADGVTATALAFSPDGDELFVGTSYGWVIRLRL